MNEETGSPTFADAKTVVADKLAIFKNKIESLIAGDRFHEVKANIKEIIEHTQDNFSHLDKEVKGSLKKTSAFLAQQKKELEQFQLKINALLKPKVLKKALAKKTAKKVVKKTAAQSKSKAAKKTARSTKSKK